MALKGVDLSSFQTVSNWAQFNAAIDFVYLRVYRSSGAQDTQWRNFYANFNGPRAPYIFLRDPSIVSFANQFATFWGWANDVAWEWGPVIDCEFAGITAADVRGAIAACRTVTGRQLVYVYLSQGNLSGPIPFSSFATDDNVRVIGARYFTNNFAGAFANFGIDNPHLDIVQYWDAATVPGVTTCDVNNARQLLTIQGSTNNMTAAFNDRLAARLDKICELLLPGNQPLGFESHTQGSYSRILNELDGVSEKVDTVKTAVANDDAHTSAQLAVISSKEDAITTAVAALPTTGATLTADQLTALGAALAAAVVPALPAGLSAEQAGEVVTAALRAEEQRIAAL